MGIRRSIKNDKIEDAEPILYEEASSELPEWVNGFIDTPIGKVRRVKTEIGFRDRIGGYKVRWGIKRYEYRISPGIYAVGAPDSNSEVLVTANYKLTFDMLRKELSGMDLWIVVLDTDGINVWCAAGKGTFGTAEVIERLKKLKLSRLVAHRRIILPQLGAPGVAAYNVTKLTGFSVVYGPIYAKDIRAFLNNGRVADDRMREVRFRIYDRLVLTPMELVYTLRVIPFILVGLFLLNLSHLGQSDITEIIMTSVLNAVPYILALFTGAFVVPLLLPWIPFKAFSLKGALLGFLLAIFTVVFHEFFRYNESLLVYFGNSMLLIAITSFIALNFTGCTTYTSLSGVKLETKWTTILAGIGGLTGLVLLIINAIATILG